MKYHKNCVWEGREYDVGRSWDPKVSKQINFILFVLCLLLYLAWLWWYLFPFLWVGEYLAKPLLISGKTLAP